MQAMQNPQAIEGPWYRLYSINGDLKFETNWFNLTTVETYNDNIWHHVAAVRQGSIFRILVDGQEETAAETWQIGDVSNSAEFTVGKWIYELAYSGVIDDVRLWQRALTNQEIWLSMHSSCSGEEADLLAAWDFNEGNGQISYDLVETRNGIRGQSYAIGNDDPEWVPGHIIDCMLGDITGDILLNVLDIVATVDCIVSSLDNCDCADMDGNGSLDVIDIVIIVDIIINQ